MAEAHLVENKPVSCPGKELHLYSADFADFDAAEVAASGLDWLDAHEQRRYRRYHLRRHRERFLLGRVLLRQTLSRYAAASPAQWQFVENAWGKPALARQPAAGPLHFNLSHSGTRLLLAVGRHELLGVDVERSDRPRRLRRIARRYFSATEVAALLALPEAERLPRFYRLWTLKEAYIKARGSGLALGLARFSFDFEAAGTLAFSADPGLQEQPAAWQFWQFPLAADYEAAVAGRGAGSGPLTLRHWRLQALDRCREEALTIAWHKPAVAG
ncbi:MAG: 4'-phosphopantetheinyl transferase superfamily protein [Pseudohongiellaceae bacterium]